MIRAKNGKKNRHTVWAMHLDGPKEACIRWGPDPPCRGAIIRGKDMPRHARHHSTVSCAKMAELIDLPFGLWTRVGQRSTSSIVFASWHQCALTGGHTGAPGEYD